jgi:tryptophanyl-tRNA synthetase
MHPKTVFYNLSTINSVYFASYLSSFLEIKKIILQPADQVSIFIMLSDLHSMKIIDDRKIINNNIRDSLICLLASGLGPVNKHINVFCQSAVLSHTNLAWFLSYISKANQSDLLFAADILMYKSSFIAADINQIQNINLTIDLANKFNIKYNTNIFNAPTILLNSLNRTSHNIEVDNFFNITMFDDDEVIANKIKNSNLQSGEIIYDYDNNPVISRLIDILAVLTKATKNDIILSFGASGFSAFKNAIIDATIKHMTPIKSAANKLKSDTAYLTNIIKNGNQKANFIANNMVEKIKSIMI